MKKVKFTILLLSLLLGACKSSDVPCYNESWADTDNNPVQTTRWLKELRSNLLLSGCEASVSLYNWNGEAYYYLHTETPEQSNDFPPVTIYRPDGSIYSHCGGNSHPDLEERCNTFLENASLTSKLWEIKKCY